MNANVIWQSNMQFTGKSDSGASVEMDTSLASGGTGKGFTPMELMLIGMAGCTAMDVISILKKKQQQVTGFTVSTATERAEEHPHVFTHITIEYKVAGKGIDPHAVERAVELSETKYCSGIAMLGKTAKIEHKISITNE